MGLQIWQPGLHLPCADHRCILGGAVDTPQAIRRDIRLNLLLPPMVFVVSAAVALLNAEVAMYLWLLLIPVYVFRRRREITVIGDEV